MLSLNLPDRRLGKFDSTCGWGGGGWAAAMGEWQLCGRSGGWGAWLWHRVWRGGGPADLDAEAVRERVLWARCLVLGCPLILRMSGGLVMSGTVCVCVCAAALKAATGGGAHRGREAVGRPQRVLLADAVRTDAEGVRVGVVARAGRVRATLPSGW